MGATEGLLLLNATLLGDVDALSRIVFDVRTRALLFVEEHDGWMI